MNRSRRSGPRPPLIRCDSADVERLSSCRKACGPLEFVPASLEAKKRVMIAPMEPRTASTGFAGLRVLSLESRRAAEMAKLIATFGGEATVAPSMREVPLESNVEAQAFTRGLLRGDFDLLILLTGV